MSSKFRVAVGYNRAEEPVLKLLCARMLEDAFRRREDCILATDSLDLAVNTLPLGEIHQGTVTAWWDIESCTYQKREYFNSDLVLVPYHGETKYPADRTYLFPFATDPEHWRYHPCVPEYDVGFLGREDCDRTRRARTLKTLQEYFGDRMLRTNNIERGEPASRLLSKCRITLCPMGDALGGVMETRFFEISTIQPMAVEVTETNSSDLQWAATPGAHYIPYSEDAELIYTLERYLQNPHELQTLALAARRHFSRHHTYDSRAAELLELVQTGKGLSPF